MQDNNANFLLGNSDIYYLGGTYYTEKEDEVVPLSTIINMDKKRLAEINTALDLSLKELAIRALRNNSKELDLWGIEQSALKQLLSISGELGDAYPIIRNNIYVALNNAKVNNKYFVYNNNVFSCVDFELEINTDKNGHFIVEVISSKDLKKEIVREM